MIVSQLKLDLFICYIYQMYLIIIPSWLKSYTYFLKYNKWKIGKHFNLNLYKEKAIIIPAR